jgi:hypothetical protein
MNGHELIFGGVGLLVGIVSGWLMRPGATRCPKCHALAEGAFCKRCGAKFDNPEVATPVESFDEVRKYLASVAKWGKPCDWFYLVG